MSARANGAVASEVEASAESSTSIRHAAMAAIGTTPSAASVRNAASSMMAGVRVEVDNGVARQLGNARVLVRRAPQQPVGHEPLERDLGGRACDAEAVGDGLLGDGRSGRSSWARMLSRCGSCTASGVRVTARLSPLGGASDN